MSLTLFVTALVIAGLAAGLANTAATGGGLILFVVLTALTGDPMVANATGLMAMPFCFASKLPALWRHRTYSRMFVAAGAGCATGVVVLACLGNVWFALAAPWLILTAVALLAVEPLLKRLRHSRPDGVPVDMSPGLPTLLGLFLVSIYAGVFGASFGTLVLAVLMLIPMWTATDAAPVKNLICLATSVVGLLAIPALQLPVNWTVFAILAGPLFVGGLLGGKLLMLLSEQRIKVIAVTVSLAGAAMMFMA